MDRQAEYLIARNQIRRGQIAKNFFTLPFILAVLSAALWYFEPTSNVANLPYCLNDLFSGDSSTRTTIDSIKGIFIARDSKPVMDPFGLPRDAFLLRFDSNGKVIYTSVQDYRHLNWRKISTWFYLDSTDYRVHHATYEVSGSQVQLLVKKELEDVTYVTWIGRYTYGEIVFENATAIWKSAPEKLIFRPLIVEQCPFGNQ